MVISFDSSFCAEVSMFFRVKTTAGRRYLQLVESSWEGDRTRQRVIASLGRLDGAEGRARVDGLRRSLERLLAADDTAED